MPLYTTNEHWTVICVLLCSGFKEQIYDVYRYLPPATQVLLISATLPHEILEMTSKFMTDPIRILVKRYSYTHFVLSLQAEIFWLTDLKVTC